MKLNEIYVLYKNGDKFFKSYEEAWKHHYLTRSKLVKYVFTPTMTEYRNVSELEHGARLYFNNAFDMDYLDIITGTGFKQQKLF